MKAQWVLLALFSFVVLACSPQSRGADGVADMAEEVGGDVEVVAPTVPLKLDVLWVVDNGADMCQEQRALVDYVGDFVDALPVDLVVDLRMAVTLTDVIKGQGAFVEGAAIAYPNACAETRILPCTSDSDCLEQLGESWDCYPPPSSRGQVLMESLNGSLNSRCSYVCESGQECCDLFCTDEACDPCTHACVSPGGGVDTKKGCVAQPLPCEGWEPGDWDAWARCHLQVGGDQSFTASLESGIKAAWMALDPEGFQADRAAGFLRPDAHLLIVFVSNEEDCSISEEFCSPSYTCEEDNDCPGYTRCGDGACCGVIKKDYYNICGHLGEYRGPEHHACAYDLDCQDCETDTDCEPGWYCKSGKKCRPEIYSFNTVASLQQPAGTPLFALAPVDEYADLYRSLKEAPQRVLVATITGDSVVSPDDAVSMISEACLARTDLDLCQAYLAARGVAAPACLVTPAAAGCEAYLAARQDCAQQCYMASRGDNKNPQAKASYICHWDGGSADWGGRYARLTESFGDDGLSLNLCAPEGFGPLMQRLGEFVSEAMER